MKPEAIAQIKAALAALYMPMNIESGLQEIADRLRSYRSAIEPKAMCEVISHIAAQDAESVSKDTEIARLREALTEYANAHNWQTDEQHIRRVWIEPNSTTPSAYNGFELARAALTTKGPV